MTNRQSNIIFYGVIAMILYGLVINHLYPDFFGDLGRSKEELSIKEAVAQGDHQRALTTYQKLVAERVSGNEENTIETADMYEEMAKLNALLGKKTEEKNDYSKSLEIKKQLKKVNPYSFANTYFKLGTLAEEAQQYEQAQQYYEQSLETRLGNIKKLGEDEGVFEGLQNTQLRYKRLNNEGTIAIFKRLGALHAFKNEDRVAKKYYERALAASKLTFGEDDSRTLEMMDLIKQF